MNRVDLLKKDFEVKRIFRKPRYTRGDTNIRRIQEINNAYWIWHPVGAEDSFFNQNTRVLRFKRTFESDGTSLVFDISADNRFVLFIDGALIARGPNRAATVENWQYHTYEVTGLSKGEHKIEVVCWTLWDKAPLQQLSWRGGFILKAEGAYAEKLDTAMKDGEVIGWEVGEILGTGTNDLRNMCWGTGRFVESKGTGLLFEEPKEWVKPCWAGDPAGNATIYVYGARTPGWMLFPTQLPDQIEEPIDDIGEFVVAMDTWKIQEEHIKPGNESHPMVAKFNALIKEGKAVTIPANTTLRIMLRLNNYYGVYPFLGTNGGKGAVIDWGWAESLYHDAGPKGMRMAYDVDKFFIGAYDRYEPDGRAGALFTTQWWRCGHWCDFKITTGDEPLEITSLFLHETRYPLEQESSFECDDESFKDIQRICVRAMQMCDHEMLFDCPYYEQQMYPGDTRVQLLTLTSLSRDDRMIRRAIETYDFGQRDDGMVPMNWPTRGLQESGTYTQCWIEMFRDFVRYHDNKEWLKARLPAMRKAMAAFEVYENEDGLIVDFPGWSFMDWVKTWHIGTCPSGNPGDAPSSIINLFYVANMQTAAMVERAMGHEYMAKEWEAKAEPLKAKILEIFWDEEKGMLADTTAHDIYSEHAQCLGIITDTLTGDKAKLAFENMLAAPETAISRSSVYFSYYLFEAYFKMGRGDLFLKRLDLWRSYVKIGLSTTMESPEDETQTSRSDCHAWGTHPLYWMQAGLAGIEPDGFFFEKVKIAPKPGDLKFIKVSVPHTKGFIKADIAFDGGEASGTVELPEGITGTFTFGSKTVALGDGVTKI